MRVDWRSAVGSLVVIAAVVAAACTESTSPTSTSPPTSQDGADRAGDLRAQDEINTPVAPAPPPGGTPVGPAPGPGGGGGGGGGTPGNTPVGPAVPPGVSPTPPPAPPGPSSPPGPTPTPFPSASPCPPTHTVSVTTPFLLRSLTVIKPEESFGRECVMDRIEVTLFLTTTRPSIGHSDDGIRIGPAARLGVCGTSTISSGCTSAGLFQFPDPDPTVTPGQTIGATCGDLTFDTAATAVFAPYATPPPPYSGRYRFREDSSLRDDTGTMRWHLSSKLDLLGDGGPSDLTVQCVTLRITTRIVTP